jgi:hypothetical protein
MIETLIEHAENTTGVIKKESTNWKTSQIQK